MSSLKSVVNGFEILMQRSWHADIMRIKFAGDSNQLESNTKLSEVNRNTKERTK